MAEIVNLRQARKNKLRAEKVRAADGNRAKFGRSKSERESADKQADLDAKRLDFHKRESDSKE
ncbi:DUF4169 family protein [Pelagibacterium sp.]|uniref:DUF4169 family protein n=1 Tax=Pelagibacterium sp. TaxID=1967288 RepID=UPI003A902E96